MALKIVRRYDANGRAVSYTHLDVYKRQEDKRKEEGTEKLVQVQNLITG